MKSRRSTVRGLLLWEYAKLIADAAVAQRAGLAAVSRTGDKYWTFVARTFRRLDAGTVVPSEIVTENKLLVAGGAACAYCGTTGALQWEHIIPRSRGGPETIDNMVLACGPCNREKADRNPVEWYGDRGLDRKHVPRLVMGKLLKLVMQEHARIGTLDAVEFPKGTSLAKGGVRSACRVFDLATSGGQAARG